MQGKTIEGGVLKIRALRQGDSWVRPHILGMSFTWELRPTRHEAKVIMNLNVKHLEKICSICESPYINQFPSLLEIGEEIIPIYRCKNPPSIEE